MVTWNDIYEKYGVIQTQVDSFVVRNIDLLQENDNKVYDYGAGTGRNTFYLAELGFDVITFDSSFSSRKLLHSRIDKGLEQRIHILQAPLNGSSNVNIALSVNSIHHGTYDEIRKGINNLIMPVKKGGLVLFKGLSHNDFKSQDGIKIENGTRIDIPCWKDGSIPHHFFIENELQELFSNLDVLSINEKTEPVEFFEDAVHTYFELIAKKK